jgi:catechol 2,3-dioxygenase
MRSGDELLDQNDARQPAWEDVVKIDQLGHVVIKVRDRDRAERFYGEVLGMPIVARRDAPPMTFFSLGNHHDFAVLAVGDGGPDSPPDAPGLFHVAFRVGESVGELREAKEHLEANGVTIDITADHTVTKSLYFADPDGNMVELYVDSSNVWRVDPDRVGDFEPLTL